MKANNIPIPIQAAKILLTGRLLSIVFILVFCGLTIEQGLEGSGVLFELKRLVFEKFQVEGDDEAYRFGYMLGYLLIPIAANILSLVGVITRKYTLSIVCLAIDFLFIMGKFIPMVPIIVLVLLFLPPSRKYFGLRDKRINYNDEFVDSGE